VLRQIGDPAFDLSDAAVGLSWSTAHAMAFSDQGAST
jgi:hypothetical protein